MYFTLLCGSRDCRSALTDGVYTWIGMEWKICYFADKIRSDKRPPVSAGFRLLALQALPVSWALYFSFLDIAIQTSFAPTDGSLHHSCY